MYGLEQVIIQFMLNFTSQESINAVLNDPRIVAIIIGGLVAASGGLLGVFLKLRHMSLTTDAISHTILLGIVVAFIVMSSILGLEPDLSSPGLRTGSIISRPDSWGGTGWSRHRHINRVDSTVRAD